MMFDKSTRTLMAMLMQRGMTEMSRTFNINGFDRHRHCWVVVPM
jgi:hypothetical protein